MPSARLASAVEEVETVLTAAPFETTEHHALIFEAFQEGSGHLRVEAYAGTGKSTTILRAIDLAPEDAIWLATFGKRNQLELDGRLTNPRATAQTIHSLGKSAISQNWGWLPVCKRFEREDDLATRVTAGAPYGAKRLVGKLCTKAREIAPFADHQALVDLALDFDLAPPADGSLSLDAVVRMTLQAMELAAGEKPRRTGIDFADMLFLPMRNDWLQPQFDMVVVDEYQDLTLAQLLFCRKVCYSYGRIILVGDRHQAIYRFRGAGGNEVAKLMANLKPEEFMLPKTYRCPRKVVELAEPFAPGYTADPSAPEGVVDQMHMDKLAEAAQPGDFILSRANAPLMPVMFALLRADKPATIRGRDIAKGLISLVTRLAVGDAKHSIPAFLAKVRNWKNRETVRAISMKREDLVDGIEDKAETLNCLASNSTGVPHLLDRLDKLFTDEPTKGVVLSTVHKAKGLEANRVFLLRNTFLRPQPCKCGHHHAGIPCRKCVNCPEMRTDSERLQEEKNLMYVAITRARQHLTMVMG